MAQTPNITYQDMCEYIWNVMNPAIKPPLGRELRVAKMAVLNAYRDLANRHAWNYYKRRSSIATEAYYNTGTIDYDHADGTYSRQVTLAGGSWPVNAARGFLVIGNNHYSVSDRKSSTVITLGSASNPGADIAAGTTYTWYRNSYPMPISFRRMLAIVEASGGGTKDVEYLEPSTFMQVTRDSSMDVVGDPEYYTILNDGDYIGAALIVFGPAPKTALTYDIMFNAAPRELRTYKYSDGTISIDAGTTTVTGVDTQFASAHAGCIIRFTGSKTTEPTGFAGGIGGADNPYSAQRTIMAVNGTTTLTVDQAVSSIVDFTDTYYTISDPIDIEPIVMRTPLEMGALYHFARLTKRKDATPLERDYEKALLYAMEQDRRVDIVETVADSRDSSNVWGDVDTIPT